MRCRNRAAGAPSMRTRRRSVASDAEGHIIETTQGERLRYLPRVQAETGVVDLSSGAEADSMQTLPMRVHELGAERSLVVVTMIMPDEMAEAVFDGLVVSMSEELDRLAVLVSSEHAQPV